MDLLGPYSRSEIAFLEKKSKKVAPTRKSPPWLADCVIYVREKFFEVKKSKKIDFPKIGLNHIYIYIYMRLDRKYILSKQERKRSFLKSSIYMCFRRPEWVWKPHNVVLGGLEHGLLEIYNHLIN